MKLDLLVVPNFLPPYFQYVCSGSTLINHLTKLDLTFPPTTEGEQQAKQAAFKLIRRIS